MNPRCLLALLPLVLLGADWPKHPENYWVKQSPTDQQPAPLFSWEGSGAYDPSAKNGFTSAATTASRRASTCSPTICNGPLAAAISANLAARRLLHRRRQRLRCRQSPLRQLSRRLAGPRLPVEPRRQAEEPPLSGSTTPTPTPGPTCGPLPIARPLTSGEHIGGLNAGAAYDPAQRNHHLLRRAGIERRHQQPLFYDAYANKLDRIAAPARRVRATAWALRAIPRTIAWSSSAANTPVTRKRISSVYRTGKWEAHDLNPAQRQEGQDLLDHPPNGLRLAATMSASVSVRDDATSKHETWTLDVAKLHWTKMEPATEPEPSMSRIRNLDFSPEHNVFILDTNPAATKGKGAQIWTYRYKKAPPTEPPGRAADLEAVSGANQVTLTWSAVAGAKEYRVARAVTPEPWKLTFTKVVIVRGTSFEDRKVKRQNYVYTVQAVAEARRERRQSPRPLGTARVAQASRVGPRRRQGRSLLEQASGEGRGRLQRLSRPGNRAHGQKGEPKAWSDNDPEYAEPIPVEVSDITDIRKLNETPQAETVFTDEVDLAKPGPESKGYKYAVHAYIVRAVNKLGVESGPSPYALTIPSEPTNVLNREKRQYAPS